MMPLVADAPNFKYKHGMDVYDVSDDLIEKIKSLTWAKVVSFEFNHKETTHGKVRLVELFLLAYEYMDELERNLSFRISKSNEKSTEYRLLGNQQFTLKNGDYFQALEFYNKSICYADAGSENIAIGYANRSAVLFALGYFRQCLVNIEWARKANYPKNLMHKLDKRESNCLKCVDTQADDVKPIEFRLKGQPHPNLPTVSSCVELRSSPKEGRYLIATEDLVAGDMVAIEEPFCSSLLPVMRYVRCAHCKSENFLTLMPCEFCCSAMFCSKECLSRAWAEYHKWECPIIDMLFTFFNKIHHIALRTTLTALSLFSSIEEAISFCADQNNQQKTAFDLDHKNLTPKERYRAVHGLETNFGVRNTADLFQRAVLCAMLEFFLFKRTSIREFLANEEGENMFIDLLFRHLQTSAINMHNIETIEDVNGCRDDEKHSTGAFPFLSLLNHSCAPNVSRVCKGTQVYLFILRPIQAGGQLYDNYGYHYYCLTTKERQKQLYFQYRFVCSCEACERNYPTFYKLPRPAGLPCLQNADAITQLSEYNYDYALENYPKFCEYLTKYAEFYPCNQLSSIEENLKMCLHILVDAVPLKSRITQLNPKL